MSVEFNEFDYTSKKAGGDNSTATGRFFMKISGGAIKTQAQANKVTLALTVVMFAVSVYLFINGI